jgi:hypothetical protein
MLRIALGLCTGIMHNIHKNIHKADAYFSTSEITHLSPNITQYDT